MNNDIMVISDHEKPAVHKYNFDRVVTYVEEKKRISQWAKDAKKQVAFPQKVLYSNKEGKNRQDIGRSLTVMYLGRPKDVSESSQFKRKVLGRTLTLQ